MKAWIIILAAVLAGCTSPQTETQQSRSAQSQLDESLEGQTVRFEATRLDGGTIHVVGTLWEGSGDAVVVAVHGSGGARMDHAPIGVPGYSFAHEFIARDRSVVAVDMPGYGDSESPTAQTMEELASVTADVANALRQGSYETSGTARTFANVLGFGISMGGLIVQIAAAQHDSFDGVISGAWSYGGFSDQYKRCYWEQQDCPPHVLETLWYKPNVSPEVWEWLEQKPPNPLTLMGSIDLNAWAGCVVTAPTGPPGGGTPRIGICEADEALAQRQDEITQNIDVPTLLVFGQRDFFWIPEQMEVEHERFPNADIETTFIPDTGHVFLWHMSHDDLHGRLDNWLLGQGW